MKLAGVAAASAARRSVQRRGLTSGKGSERTRSREKRDASQGRSGLKPDVNGGKGMAYLPAEKEAEEVEEVKNEKVGRRDGHKKGQGGRKRRDEAWAGVSPFDKAKVVMPSRLEWEGGRVEDISVHAKASQPARRKQASKQHQTSF